MKKEKRKKRIQENYNETKYTIYYTYIFCTMELYWNIHPECNRLHCFRFYTTEYLYDYLLLFSFMLLFSACIKVHISLCAQWLELAMVLAGRFVCIQCECVNYITLLQNLLDLVASALKQRTHLQLKFIFIQFTLQWKFHHHSSSCSFRHYGIRSLIGSLTLLLLCRMINRPKW